MKICRGIIYRTVLEHWFFIMCVNLEVRNNIVIYVLFRTVNHCLHKMCFHINYEHIEEISLYTDRKYILCWIIWIQHHKLNKNHVMYLFTEVAGISTTIILWLLINFSHNTSGFYIPQIFFYILHILLIFPFKIVFLTKNK